MRFILKESAGSGVPEYTFSLLLIQVVPVPVLLGLVLYRHCNTEERRGGALGNSECDLMLIQKTIHIRLETFDLVSEYCMVPT